MRFHWGWRIGIVYTLFAAATVSMVIWTTTQRVELVADDYYDQALRHDSTNAASIAATEVGVDVSFDAGTRQIIFSTGTSRAVSNGSISLYRPSDDRLDRSLTWSVDTNGMQRIDASTLQTGRWHVVADWKDAARTYHADIPVDVVY